MQAEATRLDPRVVLVWPEILSKRKDTTMNTGKSIIDQIQEALGKMEDTGFLDDLAEGSEEAGTPQAEETELWSGYRRTRTCA